jgi:cellulose synthase (UDP-forming)
MVSESGLQDSESSPPRSLGHALLVLAICVMIATAVSYLGFRLFFVQHLKWELPSLFLIALFLAEVFVVFHSIAYGLNCLRTFRSTPPRRAAIADWSRAPRVAVLMPARHEPFAVLDRTLRCLKNLDYPNKTVYFLDDSSDERYLREAETLALRHGVRLYRRAERHGAKAGIINDCVRTLGEEYVAIFDADQNPTPDFLKDVIPILEGDQKLAFVQTPQFYTNGEASPIAFGANLQHCIFYEYICEGKSTCNAMIMCGTNVAVRRQAFVDVGGLDERSITEDFSTTIEWHRRGWKSLFYNRTCVFGSGPESLDTYLKQQFRWSRGNLGVLRKLLGMLVREPWSLSPAQWWEHLATGSYYLMGVAYLIFMAMPVLYIFFGVRSFYMPEGLYVTTFVPYFCLAMMIFMGSMARRHYRLRDLVNVLLLGFITFPVFVQAAWGALVNSRARFTVTEKGKTGGGVPYRALWPQITMWLVNLAAVVWGLNTVILEMDWSIVVSMLWAGYHFILLSSVFYYRLSAARAPSVAPEASA